MTSDDNVIKNPHRKEYTPPMTYVPEYVRLGIDPIAHNFGQHDVASVDDTAEDDAVGDEISVPSSLNSHILDNNEFVSFGFQQTKKPAKKENPDVGEFIVMVKGKILGHGNHEYVLAQAKSALYGEHPSFMHTESPMEDIIILKRVGLKIGVFLDGE